jgi:hypothetical protein
LAGATCKTSIRRRIRDTKLAVPNRTGICRDDPKQRRDNRDAKQKFHRNLRNMDIHP